MYRPALLTIALLTLGSAVAHAAPALSSRPGAPYTIYLNFDGFSFTGQWGNTGRTPGVVPAYTGTDAQLRESWARIAEQYSAFDINVTTVDPAIAAGQGGSDLLRQNYYDNTPKVMQTIIGGSNAWYASGTGGVSYVGVFNTAAPGGYKTNWAFPVNLNNGNPKSIAVATSHENGHALGLRHQGDNLTNTGQSNEYSTNNGATGNGSYAPTMGVAYNSQRSTWRVGTRQTTSVIQNDVLGILSGNAGLSLINDGVGKSFATASALPLNGQSVNAALASGVITPASSSNPNPIGINNYTKNYYKFTLGISSLITLTVNSGNDWVTPGTVAPGGTLRARLNLYGASDLVNALGVGIESANTLSTTYSGTLPAGEYYAEITSYGGYQSLFDAFAQYYDMGSYTLSGSGFVMAAVPEPGSLYLLLLPGIGLIFFFRRSTSFP